MMDGVPSKVNVFLVESVLSLVNVLLVESVQSWSLAPELQEDWLGTKDEIGSSNIHLYNSNLHLDLVPQDISQHQNCKRCPSTSLCELRCV